MSTHAVRCEACALRRGWEEWGRNGKKMAHNRSAVVDGTGNKVTGSVGDLSFLPRHVGWVCWGTDCGGGGSARLFQRAEGGYCAALVLVVVLGAVERKGGMNEEGWDEIGRVGIGGK